MEGRRRDSLVLDLSQAKYSTGGVASIIIIAGAGVEEVVWSGEGTGFRDLFVRTQEKRCMCVSAAQRLDCYVTHQDNNCNRQAKLHVYSFTP